MNKKSELLFISLSDPWRALLWKLERIRISSKKPFLPYNLKRYPDSIFYTMTCKASQTLETGSFKTASLLRPLYSLHQKKKSLSPVIAPQAQSNLDSSPPVMRLLSAGNHPENSSVPLHCSTMTLVFTLMLEALLLLREYCPILLSCPHMEHCSGLTLNRDFCLAEFTDSAVMFQEPSQWPSPTVTSLSLKEPFWSWGATIHFPFNQISADMCSNPTKDSSFSWSTCLEKTLFQPSKLLRLNLERTRLPFTWGKSPLKLCDQVPLCSEWHGD